MTRIQVVQHENGWKVLEGGVDTGEIYETPARAAEAARARAGETGAEVDLPDDAGTPSRPGDGAGREA